MIESFKNSGKKYPDMDRMNFETCNEGEKNWNKINFA